MNNSKNIHNSELMIDTRKLCNLFRIEKLSVEQVESGTYIFKATLFSQATTINVTWLDVDERKDLSYGVLVRGAWLTQNIFSVGTNIIKSLKRAEHIGGDERLSTTVMKNWIYDGFAFAFIFDQIEQLPLAYRQLVTQVLRDHYVLYHFLKAPINLYGHYSTLGSGFQNTADLVGFVIKNIQAKKLVGPREVFITAAILIGVGHYNQFEFHHKSQCYMPYQLSEAHEPKIVALGLLNKAVVKGRNINQKIVSQLIEVIEQLEFNC